MNNLRLIALTCTQCGAPGIVREGVRITKCDRCGARLCLFETAIARYEVAGHLDQAGAVAAARDWLDEHGQKGTIRRPEPILVPFHDIGGRRIGIFERTISERVGSKTRGVVFGMGQSGDMQPEFIYKNKEDTKVMVSDVQRLTPAARTPWDLKAFDAQDARKKAVLQSFDLVEAQRRATVYTEELTYSVLSDRKLTRTGTAEIVASTRHTLFFPFWSVPVESQGGIFEIVVEGISGDVIAWRMPDGGAQSGLSWAALAAPGALTLGYGLQQVLLGSSPIVSIIADPITVDPIIAIVIGAILTGIALWRSNRPDWVLRSWPEPDTIVSK